MQTLERLWPKVGCEFLRKRRTTFFDKRRLTLFEKTWPQLFAKPWRLEQTNARTNTRRTPKAKPITRFQIPMFFIVFFFNASRLNQKYKLTSTNWTTLAGPRLTLNSDDIRRTKFFEKLTKLLKFFCWIWHQNGIYLDSNLHRTRQKKYTKRREPAMEDTPPRPDKNSKSIPKSPVFGPKFMIFLAFFLESGDEVKTKRSTTT